MRLIAAAMVLVGMSAASGTALWGGDWPQFRGPNASGLAVASSHLPVEIGPSDGVVWSTPLPPGHSSPVIFGRRIYLNAVRDQKLLVMCLDRADGKVLWETEVPHDRLEEIHRIGSHDQCTPAADGERIVSFFGSAGLFCHDVEGKLLWK